MSAARPEAEVRPQALELNGSGRWQKGLKPFGLMRGAKGATQGKGQQETAGTQHRVPSRLELEVLGTAGPGQEQIDVTTEKNRSFGKAELLASFPGYCLSPRDLAMLQSGKCCLNGGQPPSNPSAVPTVPAGYRLDLAVAYSRCPRLESSRERPWGSESGSGPGETTQGQQWRGERGEDKGSYSVDLPGLAADSVQREGEQAKGVDSQKISLSGPLPRYGERSCQEGGLAFSPKAKGGQEGLASGSRSSPMGGRRRSLDQGSSRLQHVPDPKSTPSDPWREQEGASGVPDGCRSGQEDFARIVSRAAQGELEPHDSRLHSVRFGLDGDVISSSGSSPGSMSLVHRHVNSCKDDMTGRRRVVHGECQVSVGTRDLVGEVWTQVEAPGAIPSASGSSSPLSRHQEQAYTKQPVTRSPDGMPSGQQQGRCPSGSVPAPAGKAHRPPRSPVEQSKGSRESQRDWTQEQVHGLRETLETTRGVSCREEQSTHLGHRRRRSFSHEEAGASSLSSSPSAAAGDAGAAGDLIPNRPDLGEGTARGLGQQSNGVADWLCSLDLAAGRGEINSQGQAQGLGDTKPLRARNVWDGVDGTRLGEESAVRVSLDAGVVMGTPRMRPRSVWGEGGAEGQRPGARLSLDVGIGVSVRSREAPEESKNSISDSNENLKDSNKNSRHSKLLALDGHAGALQNSSSLKLRGTIGEGCAGSADTGLVSQFSFGQGQRNERGSRAMFPDMSGDVVLDSSFLSATLTSKQGSCSPPSPDISFNLSSCRGHLQSHVSNPWGSSGLGLTHRQQLRMLADGTWAAGSDSAGAYSYAGSVGDNTMSRLSPDRHMSQAFSPVALRSASGALAVPCSPRGTSMSPSSKTMSKPPTSAAAATGAMPGGMSPGRRGQSSREAMSPQRRNPGLRLAVQRPHPSKAWGAPGGAGDRKDMSPLGRSLPPSPLGLVLAQNQSRDTVPGAGTAGGHAAHSAGSSPLGRQQQQHHHQGAQSSARDREPGMSSSAEGREGVPSFNVVGKSGESHAKGVALSTDDISLLYKAEGIAAPEPAQDSFPVRRPRRRSLEGASGGDEQGHGVEEVRRVFCQSQEGSKPKARHKALAVLDLGKPMTRSFSPLRQRTASVLGLAPRDVNEKYVLGKVLGEGQFGITRLAECRSTKEQFACKTISKKTLKCKNDVEDVKREHTIFEMLKGLPLVPRLQDTYETSEEISFVMELCKGGDLFDRLRERQRYTEAKAACVMRSVLQVLQYCHEHHLVHRDIKPENVLLCCKSSDTDVKVIDFGIAAFVEPGSKPLTELMGSPFYIAPEVIEGSYGCQADIWSAGVMLYVLLVGVPPFWAKTEAGILRAIRDAKLKLPKSVPLSEAAKDLIRRMLTRDPCKRLTAAEALTHPWLVNIGNVRT